MAARATLGLVLLQLVARTAVTGHDSVHPSDYVETRRFYMYPPEDLGIPGVDGWRALLRRNWTAASTKQNEFYGEMLLLEQLHNHPWRTTRPEEASLFVVPLPVSTFPGYLPKLGTHPALMADKADRHVVLCTHWMCGTILYNLTYTPSGALHQMRLHGALGVLERNAKWFIAELWRKKYGMPWIDAKPETIACADRMVVLPYPAHSDLVDCRSPARGPLAGTRQHRRLLPAEARDPVVFYVGMVRKKPCGEGSFGVRAVIDPLTDRRASRSMNKARRKGIFLASRSTSASGLDAAGTSPSAGGSNLSYAEAMSRSLFCLHLRGDTPTSRRFFDAVAAGCLPVVVSDWLPPSLPFVHTGAVNYSRWVTFIPEARWKANPWAAMDDLLASFATDHGGMSRLRQMQRFMLADAPKLLFCVPGSDVASYFLYEAFERVSRCTRCRRIHPTKTFTEKPCAPQFTNMEDCVRPLQPVTAADSAGLPLVTINEAMHIA